MRVTDRQTDGLTDGQNSQDRASMLRRAAKTNTQLQELPTCVCVSLCTNVVHNTAQNSSDNFPSCPQSRQSS